VQELAGFNRANLAANLPEILPEMRCASIRIFLIIAAVCISRGRGQQIISGSGPDSRPILVNADIALLEDAEPRKDLNCAISPDKPTLGFDLKFHAGYSVSIPIKDLEGSVSGSRLSLVFRVTAKDRPPVYFDQHFRVPPIREPSGTAVLDGTFDVGEGDYHIDWLMRDFEGRYCSSYWDLSAALSPKEKQVAVALAPQAVTATQDEQFQAEPPVARIAENPLNVKVMMNFAPLRVEAAALLPQDRVALVSILRNLSRNPRIGKISLVTFNVQQERVIYRQDFSNQIDFPALGRALKLLNLGTVDFRQLTHKNGDTQFLADLTRNELAARENVDGLIFVGPKSSIDASIPEENLKQIGEPDFPLFYMNYTPDPLAVPWRDTIGRMVKFLKGREYIISGPRDLSNALSEVLDRIVKSKGARPAVAPARGSER
jgi:hypothetical protein